MTNMDKFKDTFREEAYELLASLEDNLLELESNPNDKEIISTVFRIMHTIKGSSAMFGFDLISSFTHEIESIMDEVRSGKIMINDQLINLVLKSKDLTRDLLDPNVGDGSEYLSQTEDLISALKSVVNDDIELSKPQTVEEKSLGPVQRNEQRDNDLLEEEASYRIKFIPNEDIFLSGSNPVLLLEELSSMGEYSAIAHIEKVPNLEELNPEKCLISWEILLTTRNTITDIRDVFIFVENSSKISIDLLDDYNRDDNEDIKKVGEILMQKGIVGEESIEKALKSQKKIGEVLLEQKLVSQADLDAALQEQERAKKAFDKRNQSSNTLRVDSDKLDELIDLVGELVTLQARLSQLVSEEDDSQLTAVSEHLERLSSDLRDNTMSLRMLPIGTTFSKYKRLVRDLSLELGKKVVLFTEGGETELDKSVLDKLGDPLVHLIRNSLDHGIETPAQRKKLGKKEEGQITLKAEHSGAFVIITIQDDGFGINKSRLIEKAVNNGIIISGEGMSDAAIFDLIFNPGFSTAQEVTSVSGRGVGMDVVKRSIEALGGTVSVESEENSGTTIRLSIPLTLAIIEGLLVRVGKEHYVIPLNSVEACIELTESERALHPNRNILNYRGSALPYIRIKEIFEIQGELKKIEQIVVINTNDMLCGFVVDEVIGDYQTVIKSLGIVFQDVDGISGATILGDGSIALILDIIKLGQHARETEKDRLLNVK